MSLFVFNNQQKLIKSIPNRDLISVVQDQAINVSDTLFVEMPADIWSNLKEPASYLAVQDPYERFSYHMYKVSKHTTKADTTDIEAIQVGYDELKAYGYIKDRRFSNRPVLEAATAIVDGTDWQLGYVDTNLPNVNTNFYYISRLEALSKLIEATGAEVRFRIEISGNKIIAKRLDLYKQLGTFKGKRFAYGSNLLEIVKEEDTSELYTALVGRGKGEETDTGGFGRRITFADVAWSKASGKPVDKPLGQEFIELPEMTAYYGYPDGEPRTGIVEFGDIEEPEQLLESTYERLVEISRPQVQFKAKVQTTGDMQLGEEVAIIRSDLGFRYKTRVFRVKRDYLNNMYTEVELGDKLTESLASRIKKIDTTNARREETIVQYIQTAANGKNKIFRGPVEPTEGMMVNDLWYKPIGDGEMEMYQWNGAIWELILSTLDTTKVQREVEAAIAQAEEAKQEAENAYNDAAAEAERLVVEQSVAFDAKFETETGIIRNEIEQGVTNAITTANTYTDTQLDAFNTEFDSVTGTIRNEIEQGVTSAITDANNYTDTQKQVIDAQIILVEQEVSNVKDTADSAVNSINTAISNAGFSSLDETISGMRDVSSGILSEIGIAIGNAGFTSLDEMISDTRHLGTSANDNAQIAISEAQTAQANAVVALGKADNALDGVSNLDIRVDDVEAEVSLKADNTFMNEDGTLTTLSNAITFNAHRFSSDMSRIESRVESLAGEINLVILRDAFEGYNLVADSIYPNANPWPTSDTMRELIKVEQGEQLALTKITADTSDRWWRILFYNDNFNLITRVTVNANEEVITVPTNATQMWVSYPKDSQPQIVRGTDFIPYRPNLADQMTSDEVVLFRNEYEEFAEGTERRLTSIDSTGGRLEVAETLIAETANGLNLTIGKVDSQGARLTTVETIADGLQTTVSSKASQTQVTQIADAYNVLVDGFQRRKNLIPYWEVGGVGPDGNNPNMIRTPLIKKRTKGDIGIAFSENGERFTADIIQRYNADGSWHDNTLNASGVLLRDSTPYVRIVVFNTSDTNRWFQLEEGWQVTPYAPYASNVSQTQLTLMEDSITASVTNLDGRVATQKLTLDSITGTVTDLDGRVTAQKLTLDSIRSTVYNEHESKLSTLQLTADGIQGEVFNADGSSRVTQLANLYNVTIGGMTSKKNLIPYWEIGGAGSQGSNPNMIRTPRIKKRTKGDIGIAFSENGERFTADLVQRYNADGSWANDTLNASGVLLTDAVPYVRIVVFNTSDLNRWFQLEEGWYVTPYAPYVSDVNQAQISALENNINLRVTKGEVVSQINIEANRTLISSGKILLNGDTYVMGTTFVNDIKAKSLEAVNADVANLRTKILTADVVTSTHLKVDNALIDTLTATTAIVDRFYSKAAVINNLTARTLTAITANITSIRSEILIADVITSTHLKVDNALIDKMTATTAVVDRFFSKSAVIDNLSAKTLTAITANITSIRSQVLVADAVTSTHLKSDAALINKLFATTALINELTSKTAFINNVKAIDISADKINTGTLDATNVNIINLNVSKIVGLDSDFIRSNWNANGTDVSITGNGIDSTATNGSYARMIAGELRSYSADSNASAILGNGRSQYYIDGTSRLILGRTLHGNSWVNEATMQIAHSRPFAIGRYNAETNASGVAFDPYLTLEYQSVGDEDTGYIGIKKSLRFASSSLHFRSSTQALGRLGQVGVGQNLGLYSDSALFLGVDGSGSISTPLILRSTVIEVGANIDMRNYSITNQSDERSKRDVKDTTINSLSAIKAWRFVGYNWIDNEVDNRLGRQFGVIAQQTPELAMYDSEMDRWSINSSKQIMMNSHAIQQLALREESTNEVASQALQLGESNEDKIHKLQQELSQANRRIEELEREIA